jgi:hypothetical protein
MAAAVSWPLQVVPQVFGVAACLQGEQRLLKKLRLVVFGTA